MSEVHPRAYVVALFVVMVISVMAFAMVAQLLRKGELTTPSIQLYHVYFVLCTVGWAILGLMEAGQLPLNRGFAGLAYFVGTYVLLMAAVERLQDKRVAVILGLFHLGAIAVFLYADTERDKLLVLSLYALVAYPAIAFVSFWRSRKEGNRGHTLTGVAAAGVVLASTVQVFCLVVAERFDLAYVAFAVASAAGFMLVGIGFLGSNLIDKLRQLQLLALRDPLTGLLNRRGMSHALAVPLSATERLGQSVCAIAMDIDHFKLINDTCGHDAGDAVLRDFAMLVANHARTGDVCCRLGGEEFVIVMPNSMLDGAKRLALRLREAAQTMAIRHGNQVIRLTCSFGVAMARGTIDLDALLKNADKALYDAKARGRNTVQISD